jgi:hypothetical protein
MTQPEVLERPFENPRPSEYKPIPPAISRKAAKASKLPLDGSRAANLLGWQWTVGAGTGKPCGFARWQVEKRAPQLCQLRPITVLVN